MYKVQLLLLFNKIIELSYHVSDLTYCMFQLNMEDDHGSQSQGSDAPMAPKPVSGSYTNLFDTREDVPLGGSAHSLRANTLGRSGNTAEGMYMGPPASRPSPVAGKKRSADVRAPMAQQDEFSPTSPIGVTTSAPQPYHAPMSAVPHYINSPSAERSMSLASDEKYPTTQALITDTLGPSPPHQPPPPRRSAGAVRPPAPGAVGAARPPAPGARMVYGPPIGTQQSRPTYIPGQARPQTYNSGLPPQYRAPAVTGATHRYPLPPTQPQAPKESGYSSSSTSKSADSATGLTNTNTNAATVDPENKQALSDVPGAIRRPMSFVKALEMSDQLQQQQQDRDRERLRQQRHKPQPTPPERITEEEEQQPQQQYGSTYEISV